MDNLDPHPQKWAQNLGWVSCSLYKKWKLVSIFSLCSFYFIIYWDEPLKFIRTEKCFVVTKCCKGTWNNRQWTVWCSEFWVHFIQNRDRKRERICANHCVVSITSMHKVILWLFVGISDRSWTPGCGGLVSYETKFGNICTILRPVVLQFTTLKLKTAFLWATPSHFTVYNQMMFFFPPKNWEIKLSK